MTSNSGPYFVLPAILLLAAFILYPLSSTLFLSLTDAQNAFVGLDNYAETVNSSITSRAARNTLYFVGVSIIVEVVLGTLVGILLNQRFRGRAAVRTLTLIPWIIPEIVAATTWAWMFHTDFGIINDTLKALGIISEPIRWLTNPDTVMPALIAIRVWKVFPFVAIMILAGLQAVPASLYEAARVDGASFWQEVRYVMIPALLPVIASVTLLLMVSGLNAMTIVYATTKGGPADRSLITSIQIFKEAFEYLEFNRASALSMLFFLVTAVFIVIYIRWTSRHAQA